MFVALAAVAAFVLLNAVYIYIIYCLWRDHFKFQRVDRSHQGSPSNRRRPLLRDQRQQAEALQDAVEPFDEGVVALLGRLAGMPQSPSRKDKQRSTIVSQPTMDVSMVASPSLELPRRKVDVAQPAKRLHMDHNYIDFVDFLWAYYLIAPCTALLAVRGFLVLAAQKFKRRGWISRKCQEPHRIVGELALETAALIRYVGMEVDEDPFSGGSSSKLAVFCWNQFPMVNADGNLEVAKCFLIKVDVESRNMISARLDSRVLAADEALILLAFNIISASHTTMHAMANWGINSLSSNKLIRQCAIATTIYNFFGFTTFVWVTAALHKVGLLRRSCSSLREVFQHGMKAGVPFHANCRELAPHSAFCDFTVKFRQFFLREFECRYKDSLNGIESEALFVGSVLHSLDHVMFEHIVQDALWFDTGSADFGLMAEIVTLVRGGFVADLPFLAITRRYKDADHPFFQSAYKRAASINKWFADRMDVCILK